jgi:hypothetical protein
MTRLALTAALILLALAPAASAAGAVSAPRSGSHYEGAAHHVLLQISGRSVELMAFTFRCGATKGTISLNDIRLRRGSRGYRFYSASHGLVTYRDGKPDENAEVHVRGLFTRDAKVVRGRFRVETPRCGNTGRVRWRATRV